MHKFQCVWRVILLQLALIFLINGMGMSLVQAALNASASPAVRIGLITNQVEIITGSNGSYGIVNADDGKVLADFSAGIKTRIGLREGKFLINNTVISGDRLRIMPLKTQSIEREDRLIEVNNRRYRGYVDIFRTQEAAGMTVVNVLTVDEYVYGVLSQILLPEWTEQAIRAQAVTLRTFTLFNVGRHINDGFDLCSTIDCQIYEGQTREDPRTLKAVEDTRGTVMTHQGYLINAYSHLSSGGHTENSENVFLKAYPYLRGMPDTDQTSPFYHWQKKISPLELGSLLKSAGYNIGQLTAIELSKRTPAPVESPDRGVSGRIRMITFIGKDGIASLTGEKLRELMSLQSSLIDISVAVPLSNIDSPFTDSFGDRDTKQILINLPPASSVGLITDRPGIHRITGQKSEMVFIDGFGSGHGVGLSLWGAKTMSEKATNPGSDYYVAILKHYFQGVKIEKWY